MGTWGQRYGAAAVLHPLALHNTSLPALAQPECPLPANTQAPAPPASAGPRQLLSAPVSQGRHNTSGNHHVQRSAKLNSPEVSSLFLPTLPSSFGTGVLQCQVQRQKSLWEQSLPRYHRSMWRCHRAMALVPGTSQRHQWCRLCDAKRRHCSALPVNPHWHFSPSWSFSSPAPEICPAGDTRQRFPRTATAKPLSSSRAGSFLLSLLQPLWVGITKTHTLPLKKKG